MALRQRYRFRAPSTGREVIIEAEHGHTYRDRDTGEVLEVVAKLTPLAPSASDLPWTLENLMHCSSCDQMMQRDLNDCPTCGRRQTPVATTA